LEAIGKDVVAKSQKIEDAAIRRARLQPKQLPTPRTWYTAGPDLRRVRTLCACPSRHMWMRLKWKLGYPSSPLDHSGEASRSKWSTALGRRSSNPKYKSVRFYIKGRRRFTVNAKRHHFARAWQSSRFDDDTQFWKSRLGALGRVAEVKAKRKLRFYLSDEGWFQ
jgi:hypothetical protein